MVFAAGSRDGFVSQYPALASISVDEWNSLIGVAATGTALLMIPARLSAEQKELTAAVVQSVHQWEPGAVQLLANLINFVTAEAKDVGALPELIGAWTLRNVELPAPERSAPMVLGQLLVNTFGPWWDPEPPAAV
jgi:hypothetical protein